MLSELQQLAEQHWILGGIFASLLWFIAARQSLSNKRPDAAIFWQSVAIIIVSVVCGWAVAQREWLGFAFAVFVLCLEAVFLKSILEARRNQHH